MSFLTDLLNNRPQAPTTMIPEAQLPEGFKEKQIAQVATHIERELWKHYNPAENITGKIEPKLTLEEVQQREQDKGETGVQGHIRALAEIAYKVANNEVIVGQGTTDEIYKHSNAIVRNLDQLPNSPYMAALERSFNQAARNVEKALSTVRKPGVGMTIGD